MRCRLAIVLLLAGCSPRGPVSPVQVEVHAVAAAPVATAARAEAARFRVGDEVEVEWRGDWWPAHVLAVHGDRYRVGYDGYEKSWDETVGPERVRERRAATEPERDRDEPDFDDEIPDP